MYSIQEVRFILDEYYERPDEVTSEQFWRKKLAEAVRHGRDAAHLLEAIANVSSKEIFNDYKSN